MIDVNALSSKPLLQVFRHGNHLDKYKSDTLPFQGSIIVIVRSGLRLLLYTCLDVDWYKDPSQNYNKNKCLKHTKQVSSFNFSFCKPHLLLTHSLFFMLTHLNNYSHSIQIQQQLSQKLLRFRQGLQSGRCRCCWQRGEVPIYRQFRKI